MHEKKRFFTLFCVTLQMWFYNTGTGRCERFRFGGCGGNANRFWSQSSCERRCAPGKRFSLLRYDELRYIILRCVKLPCSGARAHASETTLLVSNFLPK